MENNSDIVDDDFLPVFLFFFVLGKIKHDYANCSLCPRVYSSGQKQQRKHKSEDESMCRDKRERKWALASFVCYLPIKVFKNTHKSYLRLFIPISFAALNNSPPRLRCHLRAANEITASSGSSPIPSINAVWCTIFSSFNKVSYLFSMWISHEEFHKLRERDLRR